MARTVLATRMYRRRNRRCFRECAAAQLTFAIEHGTDTRIKPMKDQFPPSDWRLHLENWPFWLPSPLIGAPAPWDQIARQNTWRPAANPSGGLLGSLTQQSDGLLSSLVQPANDMAANGPSSGQTLPHPMAFAQAVDPPS